MLAHERMDENGAPMKATAVLETCLFAEDLEAAERFYTDVIGLVVHAKPNGSAVSFRCGNRMVIVFNPRETAKPTQFVAPFGTIGATCHVAFNMRESDVDAWRAHLIAKGVTILKEVKWPQGGYSLYFFDPAGNLLELATSTLWGIPEDKHS